MDYQNSTGIINYERDKPINEDWISVEEQEGENEVTTLAYRYIDLRNNNFLISTVVISLIAAAFFGVFSLKIFMIGVTIIHRNIVFASEHRNTYFENGNFYFRIYHMNFKR